MSTSASMKAGKRFELTFEGHGARLALNGALDVSTAPAILGELKTLLKNRTLSRISVDMAQVSSLDEYGVLLLIELRKRFCTSAHGCELLNVGPKSRAILNLTNFFSPALPAPVLKPDPLLTRFGGAGISFVLDLRRMIAFVGDVGLAFFHILTHPQVLRWGDTLNYMQRVGVEALPIVGLISFLLGLIMAFMSSVQLEQFGANIYVASLVALSMTRELGPTMTAIIVAGRSGSAFASEIGSMMVSEEVDALTTMGFDTTRFLVMPKMVAAIVVVPVLTIFSVLFAIIGGGVVGVTMLDLTPSAYFGQTLDTLTLFDLSWGFFKSAIFALLITLIGCYRGFQTRGGADSVGRATTSAVVSGIFLIILFDSLFAVMLRYWG
jgi:phospholipid/cholesterol/gamma-HCH transport system permease protein